LGAAFVALLFQQFRYGIEYDEGSNLMVVKNFAEGRGYASTGLLPWTWSKEFDPGASTGPALLIPGAFAWWLSGGSIEIVRLVPLAYFVLLVLFLGLLFRRLLGDFAGLIAAAAPLLLSVGKQDISTVSLVPGRYVGEIAATSLLVLMALLLSLNRTPAWIWTLGAGLAGGLAIQTKLHFALPVMVLGISWILLSWLTGKKSQWKLVLLLAGGIAAPTIVFELFRLVALGPEGYIASVKDLVAWLIGQGASADAEPFLASAGRRLGGLLSVYSLAGALLITGALGVLVLFAIGTGWAKSPTPSATSSSQSTVLVAIFSLALAASSIFVWWMFWPPEKLPRVGIPVLLIITPLVLVALFSVLRANWRLPPSPTRTVVRSAGLLLGASGVLVLVSQTFTSLTNDFGGRMLGEQRGAAAAISASATPSLPMEWIWNLAQFQILTGIPAETKPDVEPPTIEVFDSIRARVDFGVDDARAFIPQCDQVLYSSQSSVVCARPEGSS
jgi:hypothetical protein